MPNDFVPVADTGLPTGCPIAALAIEAATLIASIDRTDEAFLEAGGRTKHKLERELDELGDALNSVRDRAAYLQANSARGALFQISLVRVHLGQDQGDGSESRAVRLLYSIRRWISHRHSIEPDVEAEYFMSTNLNPHTSREAALSGNAGLDAGSSKEGPDI